MKVLLDENLPHDFRRRIIGHDVFTVAYMGWQGVENGELLERAAEAGFDMLLSNDAGLAYEQNLETLAVAVILVKAPTNALEDLDPLVPAILEAMSSIRARTLVRLGE